MRAVEFGDEQGKGRLIIPVSKIEAVLWKDGTTIVYLENGGWTQARDPDGSYYSEFRRVFERDTGVYSVGDGWSFFLSE